MELLSVNGQLKVFTMMSSPNEDYLAELDRCLGVVLASMERPATITSAELLELVAPMWTYRAVELSPVKIGKAMRRQGYSQVRSAVERRWVIS